MRISPWLSTDRLELWRPIEEDTGAALDMMSNDDVVHHNPSDRVTDIDGARQVVHRWIRHWDQHDFGYACVRRSGESTVVGFCGVVWTPRRDMVNLMYRFDPGAWGRGFATEAAGAATRWALTNLPGTVVIGRVRPLNTASRRVLEKIGLKRAVHLDDVGDDGPDLLFSSET